VLCVAGLLLFAQLEVGAAAFMVAVPRCPETADHCFGIELFVVLEHGKPVRDPAWWSAQVAHANALFAAIDVVFELADVHFIESRWAHIHSRVMRDELGRRERTNGLIHVFMVRQLDDVDIEGNLLYGVHWRDRRRTETRWIILSARDSGSTVLAHEAGHYFGLPHSTYPVSVMNKAPRDDPPWSERIFAEPEVARAQHHRDRMRESGFLVPRFKRGPQVRTRGASDPRPL